MRRMTSTNRLAVLILLAGLAPPIIPGSASAAEDGAPAPAAVVLQPVVDVGKVPVGEELEARFEIRNDGSAPLEITQVRPACGCTVAEYDEVIAPGETGIVRATVDTTSILGPNAKGVTVFTNDAGNPRIQLTVKSDVRPFLSVDPGYARFTSFVRHERDQTASQLLSAPDFQDLEVVGVESPQPWIEVEFREAGEDERTDEAAGRQWRIDVTLAEDAPMGPVADHVLVRTNHPDQETVEIPVSGFVRPVVAVTPSDVDFGRVDPAEEQQWGILVKNFGSAPLRIEGVRSEVAGIRVEVEPIEEGQQYKLVFIPTRDLVEGAFDGTVELVTNLPQQPTISVEVRGERI